jgi:hypothetical protein
MTSLNEEYPRDRLIAICEQAVVPVKKWGDRDSPSAHEKLGLCWVMLKAGCDYRVIVEPKRPNSGCVTDDRTIWLEIRWPSFSDIEWGDSDNCSSGDTFYLPTEARLDATKDGDWY